MAIFDLFSKRQKRLRGEVPDVYVYDQLPKKIRVQIVHIISDAIGYDSGRDGVSASKGLYRIINDALCREYGVIKLNGLEMIDDSVLNYFIDEKNYENALDFVELSFSMINKHCRDENYAYRARPKLYVDDAIDELNSRFKEHGIGYQFESGEIIRVDSQYLHAESVKPVLALIRDKMYSGANDEFMKAHEHYRHGRHKECLNEALKAFESVMKAICKKHGWAYAETDTAKALIEKCFSNDLIPSYLQSQFSSLRTILESGVPTVRNKNSGHGQGESVKDVSEVMARYALNMAASNILFLVEHEKELR